MKLFSFSNNEYTNLMIRLHKQIKLWALHLRRENYFGIIVEIPQGNLYIYQIKF